MDSASIEGIGVSGSRSLIRVRLGCGLGARGSIGIPRAGKGGNGRRSPFEFAESVLVGESRASTAEDGLAVGAGLLSFSANGFSM